jgi:hypothetical protein
MFLTNNQAIYNFDHLVDIESLIKLRPYISGFVARNFHLLKPNKFISGNFDSGKKGIYDHFLEYKENLDSLDPTLKDMIQTLIDYDKFGNWVIFENETVTGNCVINCRYLKKSYKLKHLASECVAVPEDVEMTAFYHWLDNQHIFDQYGRVAMFVNLQNCFNPMHVDHYDSRDANNDEFVWISFSSHKRFFVYDAITKEKIYAKGHCNWFNTGNWHGTDPAEQACYSIRVDGVFSQQFRQAMNRTAPS